METNQVRALSCRQSVLERADGSCLFAQGNTQVLVAVYGPQDTTTRRELIDRSCFIVTVKPNTGHQNYETTYLEYLCQNFFENQIVSILHPRTQVHVVLQVINDDGSLLACCINAINMALVDAGVPMRSMSVGVTLSQMPDQSFVIDPTQEVEGAALSTLTFHLNQQYQILSEESTCCLGNNVNASISTQDYFNFRNLAREAAKKYQRFVLMTTTSKCLYECKGDAYMDE
eukprot:TRINITY_DN9441_c0_g1_i2.p1 TRINITY_DN9441_c0_g1~~TRINITY_DN9441_c0_g1_i2.p1  ORF type:complete len:230 (+),score=32.70 TRINITY_DN9441_c0_g1_i2:31-720(+)